MLSLQHAPGCSVHRALAGTVAARRAQHCGFLATTKPVRHVRQHQAPARSLPISAIWDRSEQPGRPKPRDVSAGAIAATGRAAKAASDSLAAAVTAANMPLWLLGLRCLGSAAAATCAAMAISRVLHQAADRSDAGEDLDWTVSMSSSEEDLDDNVFTQQRSLFKSGLDAFMVALHRPAALFIPVVAVAYSIKEVESYLRAILQWQLSHNFLSEIQHQAVETGIHLLVVADKLIEEIDELAIIALTVWVLLRFKDRVVQIVMQRSLRSQAKLQGKKSRSAAATLERVVLPFSGLVSWLVLLAGVLMAMHVVGVNIQPLLTVGGVSGVIVGLSAQSVMANMISGINLFLSQPFVVGDRVEILTSGGGHVITGTVERVDPMRTILRSDAELPITMPNKMLSDMVIVNESRVGHSRVMQAFNKPRVYSLTLPMRFQDFPKVEQLMDAFRRVLVNNSDIDTELPYFVGVQSLENHSINVCLHMHTTPPGSRGFGGFRTRLLIQLCHEIQELGAALSYPVQVTVEADENFFAPKKDANGQSAPRKAAAQFG